MTKELELAPGVTEPLAFITQSTAILGKKGSGKTSAGVVIVEEVHAQGVPFIVVDPKGDWYGLRSAADGAPGIPVPIFGGLHGDVPLEPTAAAGKYIAQLLRGRRLSAVLDVSEFSINERAKFLAPFADELYRFDSKEPTMLVLEEAHEYIPQQAQPDEKRMLGNFERLVKLGRWKGLGVVMMTQRSASLNKNVLTQADNLVLMQTTSPQDRLAAKGWIDTAADGAAKDILDRLPRLQPGEGWLWQPSRGEPFQFRFRQRWTYDAGATPEVGKKALPAATLADVDLGAITTAMAETIEKAKADDPKVLQARVAELERQLRERPAGERVEVPVEVVREVEKIVEVPALSDSDREVIEKAYTAMLDANRVLMEVGNRMKLTVGSPPVRASVVSPPRDIPRAVNNVPVTHTSAPARVEDGELKFRAGGQRMIETLGRMFPLHLTKAQWGTVSSMKTTSGTWSTYFGELKRAGFIDSDSAGFFLTDAGFDYLGGRPAPMTAEELQSHYRTILRAGAVRMLDAIMAAYPFGLDKESIGSKIEMVTSSGTFSTYLGELVRNGLVEKDGAEYFATDILMKGAAA